MSLTMTNEELYTIWNREESPWSIWAKPVLFAAMNKSDLDYPRSLTFPPVRWALPADGSTAIIVDLPGAESVAMGLALAKSLYRPVPLYNCCKAPGMLVNVNPIVEGLVAGGPLLARLDLHPLAPPVFLLDSNRLKNSYFPIPGRFDNRWCILPQDMPSTGFLKKMGIETVLLRSTSIRDDLSHILFRYQEGGLRILHSHPSKLDVFPVSVRKPLLFKSLFYRAQVLIGLRRNSAGGFGAIIPEPHSTGG